MSDSCGVGELLTAYLDGELRPGELEVVVEHLTTCHACILDFHDLKETRAALRSLPVLEPPDAVVASAHFGTELSAYLDGELPTAEQQSIFAHLQECSECRFDLQELDAARTAVRSLPGLEPPEFLEVGRERLRRRRHSRMNRIAATVASIAAMGAIVVGVRVSTAGNVTTVDVDSFAERHMARASVEPGFQVIPAVSPGGTP